MSTGTPPPPTLPVILGPCTVPDRPSWNTPQRTPTCLWVPMPLLVVGTAIGTGGFWRLHDGLVWGHAQAVGTGGGRKP